MEQNMQRIWIVIALLTIWAAGLGVGFMIVQSDQDQQQRTPDNRARYTACFNRQLDDGFDGLAAAQICSSLSPQEDFFEHSE